MERARLEALIARVGVQGAKEWAQKTAVIYRLSICDSSHYASQPDWKQHFEQSIRELALFAKTGDIPQDNPDTKEPRAT